MDTRRSVTKKQNKKAYRVLSKSKKQDKNKTKKIIKKLNSSKTQILYFNLFSKVASYSATPHWPS